MRDRLDRTAPGCYPWSLDRTRGTPGSGRPARQRCRPPSPRDGRSTWDRRARSCSRTEPRRRRRLPRCGWSRLGRGPASGRRKASRTGRWSPRGRAGPACDAAAELGRGARRVRRGRPAGARPPCRAAQRHRGGCREGDHPHPRLHGEARAVRVVPAMRPPGGPGSPLHREREHHARRGAGRPGSGGRRDHPGLVAGTSRRAGVLPLHALQEPVRGGSRGAGPGCASARCGRSRAGTALTRARQIRRPARRRRARSASVFLLDFPQPRR